MDKSKKILRRLELLHPKKIDLSLNRLKKLLKKLGNPHYNLPPIIHIAGTNGKGSVTSFLRNIFENAKFNAHVYTSPHLVRFNERIRLNSKLISNKLLNSLLEECECQNNGEKITFFEITTAAAFLAFSRIKSDIVLMETGLGGKYDATNVIKKSLCSVLTPISMDHMNFLGSSLTKIATEKLGILKNNSFSVISKQAKPVKNLIKKLAKKKNVKLFYEGDEWEIIKKDLKKNKFIIRFLESRFEFPLPSLEGEHQINNAGTAIATILALENFKIKKESISSGISSADWPARMQNLASGKLSRIVSKKFDIWLDGGHNEHASEIIYKTINGWKEKKVILIIGMVKGKDPVKFVSKLIGKISSLIVLPIDEHNYIQPYEIKSDLSKKFHNQIEINCCLNIVEALNLISRKFKSAKILICGSLFLAGQILREDGQKVK